MAATLLRRGMVPFRVALALLGFLALAAPSSAAGRHVKGDRPLSIAQGQPVDLADFLVTDRITVFVFTSEYAAPARDLAQSLLLLHQKRDDVAVVKVDINRPAVHAIDWSSPVAVQHAIKSLPHCLVYDAHGKLAAEGKPARALIDGWIAALP